MKFSPHSTLVLALLPFLTKAAHDPSTDPNFTGPVTNAADYIDRPGFCGNADTPPTSCSFIAGENVCSLFPLGCLYQSLDWTGLVVLCYALTQTRYRTKARTSFTISPLRGLIRYVDLSSPSIISSLGLDSKVKGGCWWRNSHQCDECNTDTFYGLHYCTLHYCKNDTDSGTPCRSATCKHWAA